MRQSAKRWNLRYVSPILHHSIFIPFPAHTGLHFTGLAIASSDLVALRIMPDETKTMGAWDWAQAIAIGRRPKRTLLRLSVLISLAMVAFVVLRFWFRPIHIIGPSMLPTYSNGSFNFINCLAYRHHDPDRGDVVAIQDSLADLGGALPRVMLVKRIVGLPGDSVAFVDGRLCINGKPLDEPYLKFPTADWQSRPVHLGPNEYYYVGDNRSMPLRDHAQGVTERRRILGRILWGGNS